MKQLYEMLVALVQPLQAMLVQAAQDPTPTKLLLVIGILAVIPFTMVVPMTAACLVAGALLPAHLAPWVIIAGLLLNTLISWSVARTVFGRRIERWIEKRGGALAVLRLHAKEGGFKWTVISRFIPAPFFGAPMVLASAGVPLRTVLAGTAVTMLPWSFVYAWAGRAGREGSLKSLGLAALVVLMILGVAVVLRRRFLTAQGAKVPKAPPKKARNSHKPLPVFKKKPPRKAKP